MNQAKFGVAITADDKTAKGVASAEKRLGKVPREVGKVNAKWARETQDAARRGSRGIVRSFASIEQAGARVFGSRSITAAIQSKIGAIRDVGSVAATNFGRAAVASRGLGEAAAVAEEGMAGAAAEAGGLAAALGPVGIVAGLVAGAIVAAGVAADAVVNKWSRGILTLRNLSNQLGITTQDLQRFAGVGARYGVDEGQMDGALGGISRTFHDAKYGRNLEALGLMDRLGIRFSEKSDGTLDYNKMTMALADAVKRQKDPQTAALIAEKFGGLGALPVLRLGSRKIRSEIGDVDQHGVVTSDKDVGVGAQYQHERTRASQVLERAWSHAQTGLAERALPVMDKLAATGASITDGTASFGSIVDDKLRPAGDLIKKGGELISRAADKIAGKLGLQPGPSQDVVGAAQRAARKYGVPASVILGQYELESAHGRRLPPGSNNPFGHKARAGEPYVAARTREQDGLGRDRYVIERFRKFASIDEAIDAHGQLLASPRYRGARRALPNVDGYVNAISPSYATDRNYAAALRRTIRDEGLTKYDVPASQQGERRIVLEVHGLPHGAKVKARDTHGQVATARAGSVGGL